MNAQATAMIGHNNPPEPTPFEASKEEIDGLFMEAKNWLDGAGVQSETDADGVSKLLDMLRQAEKRADAARKEEKRPFDEGAKAVQEKFKPILDRAALAVSVCKKALTPWLEKIEAEKRAIAEAARREAEEKARAAQEAIRAAREADLEQQEKAEAMLREAQKAETAANRAAKDKAHAKGGSRATTLRTYRTAEITDAVAFARWCWLNHKEELLAFLLTIAQRRVDGNYGVMPGVTVHERKEAV